MIKASERIETRVAFWPNFDYWILDDGTVSIPLRKIQINNEDFIPRKYQKLGYFEVMSLNNINSSDNHCLVVFNRKELISYQEKEMINFGGGMFVKISGELQKEHGPDPQFFYLREIVLKDLVEPLPLN